MSSTASTSAPPPVSGEDFEPYVPDEARMAEFTPKAIIVGALFGILFGASTVYLALKAGLTVSASIPIAVLSISVLKRFGGSTILENNIVQTIGSAGESIAAGVVFTLPGFLFLANDAQGHSIGAPFFNYWTILALAVLGGVLGTLMMIPLRRPLIVAEHATLPYPEGTACASVLIAGEKGGDLARTAYQGLGLAFLYALGQRLFRVIAETPGWVSSSQSKVFPAATVNADITPEYLGVGYILGIRNSGLLVAGGVLAWLGLIPLLATLAPGDAIAMQLTKLSFVPADFGYNAQTHEFSALNLAVYQAYVKQIGAGAVAAGGFITLLKTIPTIISAFRGTVTSLRSRSLEKTERRTQRDLPLSVVLAGSVALVVVIMLLPLFPAGDSSGVGAVLSKGLLGLLIIAFGFFFVTVSSRIVGIIGTSSNPISGMTIAAIMATCLIFVGIGWTGDAYQPMALCVGGMVCIAAANAGATSQDLKTGFLVGATPRYQQIGLLIGGLAASAAIGLTIKVLDNPHLENGRMVHAIGTQFAAPQATLMATLIKGLLAHSLDWQYVLVGVAIALTVELCGVSSLAFAVGAYLPLSTTLPIFVGGVLRYFADRRRRRVSAAPAAADEELGSGNLFATGLVAGGAVAGVTYAIAASQWERQLSAFSLEHALTSLLGAGGYSLLSIGAFALLGAVLFKVALRSPPAPEK